MLPPDDPLLRIEIPPPNPDRREETLRATNLAFREKFSPATPKTGQETGLLRRLFGNNPFTPEFSMRKFNLLGGSAIALVLAVTVSTTLYYEDRPYRQIKASGNIVEETAGTGTAPTPAVMTDGKDSLHQPPPPANTAQAPTEQLYFPETGDPVDIFNPPQKPEADAGAGAEDKNTSVASEETSRDTPVPATREPTRPNEMLPYGQQPSGPPSTARRQSIILGDDERAYYAPAPADMIAPMPYPQGGDRFANAPDNGLQEVAQVSVSTFSADTDTASYSVVRRMLERGQLPPPDAVRTEEFLNYFHYDYALPRDKARPFQPTVTVYPTPWNPATRLVHIGIQAFDQPMTERPPVNLVLLVDVSGSMDEPTKLPLVKASFAMLVDKLQPSDTVAIVTYAGQSGVALPPTKASDRTTILSALNSLGAGGSTAGAEGLRTAYDLAKQNYNKEGVNRILLATDGDFNVGVSSAGGVAEYVAQQRSSGIFLSVLGFGMGNYQDTMMQAIAQNGNGVAAYIDTMSEARRILSDQVSGTLFTVAKDVKFQVEFNTAEVKSYRLLGYETRALNREDFDNDKVDAGEVGAGHEVTAIYEIVPVGASAQPGLHFQQPTAEEAVKKDTGDLAFLRIRYKLPNASTSQLIERPITARDEVPALRDAAPDVRFAAAVAGFCRLLRHSVDMNGFSYGEVISLANTALGSDRNGERQQFVDLVRTAQSLDTSRPGHVVPREDGGVAFPPAE